MKLRRRLREVRAARADVDMARGRADQYVQRVRASMHEHPSLWLFAAAGGATLTGCIAGRGGHRISALLRNPTVVLLWRFIVQEADA